MTRTPTRETLTALDRSAWEDLCANLCSLLFGAHRVEDRYGKGNGLDSFRARESGIEGWQFRRLNGRFGSHQLSELKGNVTLAATRVPVELGGPLKRFVAILNIDLEPGHGKTAGELERSRQLQSWARTHHEVELEIWGLSWVLARLLLYPNLRPDLFENLSVAISDASSVMMASIGELSRKVELLQAEPTLRADLDKKLDVLLSEARTHFARGHERGSEEQYREAIVSWNDALRLVRGHGGSPAFEGQILAVLSGVLAEVGDLREAIDTSRSALALLSPTDNESDYWWAKTNLALALTEHQELEEASHLFEQALSHYESTGNTFEIARTVQLIVEVDIRRKRVEAAIRGAARLSSLQSQLHFMMGPSELALGFLGTVGNMHMALAELVPPMLAADQREKALATYRLLEQGAVEAQLNRLGILARASIGRALWLLDRLRDAEAMLRSVIRDDDGTASKVVADSSFNLGLILVEQGRVEDARKMLVETKKRYEQAGDSASAEDAATQLRRLNQQ